jgi:hypothetical protein
MTGPLTCAMCTLSDLRDVNKERHCPTPKYSGYFIVKLVLGDCHLVIPASSGHDGGYLTAESEMIVSLRALDGCSRI